MKLKPSHLSIPEDEPFKHDVLQRKPLIESLSSLVTSVTPPFVICLDSPWGTGKTTFLELWQAHLKQTAKEKLATLYFNAWETDFALDPLVAFVSEISDLVEARSVGQKKAERIKRLKEVGGKIAKRALPAAIKMATAGLLHADDFTEGAASELMADLTTDAIEHYANSKKLIDQFRKALEDLVKEFSCDNGEPMLLVLVDEMDRCRPSYALNLLERIKHVFNTPNVVFVLALDKRQLRASVEATYGSRIDSEDYLRRFIDLEFSLRMPETSTPFTDYLFSQFDFPDLFKKRIGSVNQYDADHLKAAFRDLTSIFNLSLRARAQCFTRFRVALLSTPDDHFIYPDLLVLLVVLRAAAPDVFERFTSADGRVKDVVECITRNQAGVKYWSSRDGAFMEATVISAKHDRYDQVEVPELVRYQQLASKVKTDAQSADKDSERAELIIEFLKHMGRYGARPSLKYVLSKIELTKDD